ncbi:hypothetical protein HJ590_12775 [Naumannella sp. ID2617S]|uniref:Magnesium transporter NIPA n=1 Tax=Enemella dayhoffiae TaxID=2016507 RepID=A0A255GZV9_9ACTN|nr:hypothetical protein [Enemella dayhoffiae]NNG20422.1 hypothetical protein [Naumannella sp. ID2617S]OYO21002.1 hypothetical protein CGZ93_12430 [Enemella dayhoffiae]
MTQNIPLAIVLGVIASLCFATGATFQHDGIGKQFDESAESRTLTLKRVLSMVRNKHWLFGTAMILIGALLHLIGVNMAPVTVIQPVGILAVPFAVLLAARKNRTRPTRMMLVSIAIAVIGIVAFTWFSASSAATDTILDGRMILIASLLVFAVAAVFAVLGAKGPLGARCLAWATSGALIYGLATALMKTTLVAWERSDHLPITHFWANLAGCLACYAIGAWAIQQAYASGPAEIVVGCMTTIDPLTAVAFGLLVLGEGANIDLTAGIGMVVMGLLSALGVVLLSKYHPDAARAYEQAEANRLRNQSSGGPGATDTPEQPSQEGSTR